VVVPFDHLSVLAARAEPHPDDDHRQYPEEDPIAHAADPRRGPQRTYGARKDRPGSIRRAATAGTTARKFATSRMQIAKAVMTGTSTTATNTTVSSGDVGQVGSGLNPPGGQARMKFPNV
jgi:hypothetical protein